MQNLAKLNLAHGAISRAREILERRNALPRPGDNLVAITHQHVVEAWLAIKEGNPELAASQFSQLPKCSIGRDSPGRRAAYLAVEIQVRLSDETCRPESLRGLALELEELHTRLWDMGLQDPEAESLYRALSTIGETRRATKLLQEYLAKHRREIWPAPYLSGLVSEGVANPILSIPAA
jgi:hypothetical protein